ncbi:MAG: hypothetical protein N2C14_00800, partial [Planctomycetales bacterium]
VRDDDEQFVFDGYVNNVADGYADGINPIAALKYARAVIRKAPNPRDGSDRWVYPEHFRGRTPRLGPTFAQRNRIRSSPRSVAVSSDAGRRRWEMRELIVSKGLPRSRLRRDFVVSAGEHGRFWTEFADNEFAAFLEHKPKATAVSEVLVPVLTSAKTAQMPRGMLAPPNFPAGTFPAEEQLRLDRIKSSVDFLKDPAQPEDLKPQCFRELKSLLDDLLDLPHRVVSEYFHRPDDFVSLLETNEAVRARFKSRLSRNPGDRRRMMWLNEVNREEFIIIDEWNEYELAIAAAWLLRVQPARTPLGRFAQVVAILDDAVGGPSASVGSPHGPFWRGKTRDAFVDFDVPVASGQTIKLLTIGEPDNSNLLKALKGESPFDNSIFRRMPSQLSPVPAESIAVVEQWIVDGCPDDEAAAPTPGDDDQEQKMLQLLKDKRAAASVQLSHGSVDVAGKSLKDRFAAAVADESEYGKILSFLKTESVRGGKLIKAQDPAGSYFLTMISPPLGVMRHGFSDDDRRVVKQWILSLPTT